MKIMLFVLWGVAMFILGALSHESDMARNFADFGDAKSWVFELKDNCK